MNAFGWTGVFMLFSAETLYRLLATSETRALSTLRPPRVFGDDDDDVHRIVLMKPSWGIPTEALLIKFEKNFHFPQETKAQHKGNCLWTSVKAAFNSGGMRREWNLNSFHNVLSYAKFISSRYESQCWMIVMLGGKQNFLFRIHKSFHGTF